MHIIEVKTVEIHIKISQLSEHRCVKTATFGYSAVTHGFLSLIESKKQLSRLGEL